MDDSYFVHKAYGRLEFDPKSGTKHFEPWWALLITDRDIPRLYGWFLRKYGIATDPNGLWGSHVSVIKGDEPTNKSIWGKNFQPIEFWYSNHIRWDNQKHAWLDVFSIEMSKIRESMGLPTKTHYHLTIGRLK